MFKTENSRDVYRVLWSQRIWSRRVIICFICHHYNRYHLEHEIRRTERELRHTRQALFTYESIGETFKKLLTQYTTLTTEIDNKKWALSELNKSTWNIRAWWVIHLWPSRTVLFIHDIHSRHERGKKEEWNIWIFTRRNIPWLPVIL